MQSLLNFHSPFYKSGKDLQIHMQFQHYMKLHRTPNSHKNIGKKKLEDSHFLLKLQSYSDQHSDTIIRANI